MSKKLDVDHIALRGGTTAQWETKNPILQNKEPGIEYCADGSVKLKAGDGSTAWNSLPYIGESDAPAGDTILSAPALIGTPTIWLKGEQPESAGTGITVSKAEPATKTMLWIKGA